MSKSGLESTMALHIRVNGLPEPEREYRFHPRRKWRFDFAWPDRRIALEVEGGTWSGGRHTTGTGFTADCEKYNEAALLGWAVIRVTGDHINSGAAVDWLRRALAVSEMETTTGTVSKTETGRAGE